MKHFLNTCFLIHMKSVVVINLLPFQKKLRDNIRLAMKSCDVTQAELASRIGFTSVSISRIISGKTPLTEVHLVKFAKALGIDPEKFFTGIGSPAYGDIEADRMLKQIRAVIDDRGDK